MPLFLLKAIVITLPILNPADRGAIDRQIDRIKADYIERILKLSRFHAASPHVVITGAEAAQ